MISTKKNNCISFNIETQIVCENTASYQGCLSNYPVCSIHYNYFIENSAKCIQNFYRNSKMRRAINIYKFLPDDLQNKIIFYMRENALIKKHHHDVILSVLLNKLLVCSEQRNWYIKLDDPFTNDLKTYMESLNYYLGLLIKYRSIISLDFHEKLLIEFNKIDPIIIGDVIFTYDEMKVIKDETIEKMARFCFEIYANKNSNENSIRVHLLYINTFSKYYECCKIMGKKGY